MKKIIASAATCAILSTAYGVSASADTYTVRKGDTLSHIALKYHTSVKQLKLLNHLHSDLILINQNLQVSQPSSTPPVNVTEHTVVSGDILGRIALRYDTTVKNLKELNHLQSSLIFVGQVLKVSTNQQTQPVHPISPPPVNVTEHTVVSGDILGRIALRYDTTVKKLKELNHLQSSLIFVGQVLKVSTYQQTQPILLTQQDAPPNPNSNLLLDTAKSLIGVPYVWGGKTPSGFDCSGFIFYVYNQSGKQISRLTAAGYFDRSYYVSDPQPGDLLFFENTYKKGISHIGIYLGNNSFIHSDNDGVRITSVNDRYYKNHFDCYKRLY